MSDAISLATSIVTMQLPRRAIFSFHTFRDTSPPPGLEVWRISEDTFPDYPIQEAKRIELAISHGVGTPSVSLSQVDAPLTIAEEDGVVLTMELTGHETLAPPHEVVTTYSKIEYICGDFSIVAFEAYVPFGSFEPQLSRSIGEPFSIPSGSEISPRCVFARTSAGLRAAANLSGLAAIKPST